MHSPLELCCQACGNCYKIQPDPPEREIYRQLRRSPRTSNKHTSTSKTNQSANNFICSDCLDTIKILAISDVSNDDENDASPGSLTSKGIDYFIYQQQDDIPEDGALFDQIEIDYSKQLENSHRSDRSTFSISTSGLNASRIVSPESSKSVRTTSSNICRTCNIRTVPEEFMEYCKRCYALNCKGIELNLSNENCYKKGATSRVTTGRCRLCTGYVNNPSHQYCFKCYSAKQKDDAKRIQRELYQKQFKTQTEPQTANRIPYICVDCGNTIHDCSWKTKCPPCYAKVRASVQGKPKLVKAPVKSRFQGSYKYARR